MGGVGKTLEADGMFVIGKRKNGMGRMVSKQHVYVITERGSRKIRRLCVKDKSAEVLRVFDKHILPNSTICVDPGTENNHFKNLDLIKALHEIPGPIHVDRNEPFKNTQKVESSHSGIKMRLRAGRGLYRHNLQSWMDFEDFIYNRTDGSPQSIFKRLGDAATLYVPTIDHETKRASSLTQHMEEDDFEEVAGLTTGIIKSLCSINVYKKAKKFEVKKSELISTRVNSSYNQITGSFKSVKIYDQEISWCNCDSNEKIAQPFSTSGLIIRCECKYYLKETIVSGKCCKHIIRHLRRVIYFNVNKC